MEIISGTAIDNASGILNVKVAVNNTTDTTYWSGSNWSATETYLDVTSGTDSWVFDKPSTGWTSGKNYLVKAYATDGANKVESPGVSSSFKFDNTSPSSIVTLPTNNAEIKTLPQISGTAADYPAVGKSDF